MKTFLAKTIQFLGIVVTVSICSNIFGTANSMVGISLIIAFLIVRKMHTGLSASVSCLTLLFAFPVMGLVTHYLIHPLWLAFVIDVVLIALLMLFSGRHYENKCYIPFILGFAFLQANPVSGVDWNNRLIELCIGGVVLVGTYYIHHRKTTEVEPIMAHIKEVLTEKKLRSFIARMAIGLSFAIWIGQVFFDQKVLWISIVVISLTQISFQVTVQRLKARVFATAIGVMVFFFVIQMILPGQYYGIAMLLLGYFYSFLNEYKYQQIVTTINVLTLSVAALSGGTSIMVRVGFLIGGIAIVLVLYGVQHLLEKPLAQMRDRTTA